MFMNDIFNLKKDGPTKDDSDSNFYSILGCDSSSTTEQIMAEYRHRALQLHPDKCVTSPCDKTKYEQLFSQLLFAKDVLIDPDRRKDYDRWRQSGLNISYDQWTRLLASRAHTSMHWIQTNPNRTKAITSSSSKNINYKMENTEVLSDGKNFQIEHFRRHIDSSNDQLLNSFRNYQI